MTRLILPERGDKRPIQYTSVSSPKDFSNSRQRMKNTVIPAGSLTKIMVIIPNSEIMEHSKEYIMKQIEV